MVTEAPSRAKATAMALPIPSEDPVTMASLFSSCTLTLSFCSPNSAGWFANRPYQPLSIRVPGRGARTRSSTRACARVLGSWRDSGRTAHGEDHGGPWFRRGACRGLCSDGPFLASPTRPGLDAGHLETGVGDDPDGPFEASARDVWYIDHALSICIVRGCQRLRATWRLVRRLRHPGHRRSVFPPCADHGQSCPRKGGHEK